MPESENEARIIAGLYQAQPLIGSAATETAVKREIQRARYLHFATHGQLNQNAPIYSSIALARTDEDDGVLEARELLDLPLKADLVVLSACRTAEGREAGGEGIRGWAWALFAAQASSTVLTQWSVDDASSMELMTEFYRVLKTASKQNGIDKVKALRDAQLKLLRNQAHRHSHFWAPFILAGSWQ